MKRGKVLLLTASKSATTRPNERVRWLSLLRSFEKKQKDSFIFFGAKKTNQKKHPPNQGLDRWSTSVATRDSRSKLHSLLAAPSVPLYGKDAIDYEGNPLRQSFGMILETFLRPDGSKRPEVERGTNEQSNGEFRV